MPKNGLNVSLNSYDDIFSTEETRQEEQREQVQQIPIDELYPFKDHPFKVLDDEAMQRTVESIKQLGVTNPLIARPRPDGGYEIISGHRRQHAAQLARLKTLPVIVRDMSDDAAVLLMVDSNLQREQILPSERAFAYKMKLDALKRQGARSDLTSSQVGIRLICWWACAAVQGYGWRFICVEKTPRSTATAWSTALPGGAPPRILSRSWLPNLPTTLS